MPLWLSISLGVSSVLALAAIAYVVFCSTPHTVARQVSALSAQIKEVGGQVDALAQRWITYKAELDSFCEAMEDLAETVERKRKRIAARDSRERRTDGRDEGAGSIEDLVRAARARGFEV